MLIQKSCSRPSRVHHVPRRITTSAGPGMKILLIHPPAESSHHSVSGTTSPATANAQYHRGVMLPRKVHNGFCAGGVRRGFALDRAAFAAPPSIFGGGPLRFAPMEKGTTNHGQVARGVAPAHAKRPTATSPQH